MTELNNIFSVENELFRTYAFWSVLLIVKMFAMVFITGYLRRKTGVSNIELNRLKRLYSKINKNIFVFLKDYE